MSTKRKLPQKLGQPIVKPSAKDTSKTSVDDSRTVVTTGGQNGTSDINGKQEVVEISSDSSSEYDEDEDEDEEAGEENDESNGQDKEVENSAAEVPNGDKEGSEIPQVNGDDVEMEDAEDAADAEPSFGDLVHANADEPIDVAAAFNGHSAQPLTYPQNSAIALPSGASLGTVLSQALKTNDVTLLESCLQTSDTSTIRSTIQRLSSPLASTLLSKLATRLHNRPGRAGSLMVWIQWTLVTHGGYLATQPDLMSKLKELNHVLENRARGLQPLLSLKGKLDMLEAQIQLRRSMRDRRRASEDEEDEEGVVYVEGQESEEEVIAADTQALSVNGIRSKNSKRAAKAYEDQSESEDEEDMPNGVSVEAADEDDEDEEEESSDEEDEDLIDDEAVESEAELDEDDVDLDDQDSLPDEDDSEDDDGQETTAFPPRKMQKVGGMFGKH